MTTWRERLDARIDRCPGCDDWRWDERCGRCDAEDEAPFRLRVVA